MRGGDLGTTVPNADLWIETRVCTNASWGDAASDDGRASRNAPRAAPGTPKRGKLTLEKGRPPPGGEEARVVVHQPRGVGLIHPRLRPSNAYYTHDKPE
ncbi:hypothetical protein BST14_08090 [Mycobacterium arosiense ATCC BAA-1401 = DSM 45069]|uniref:Uncharacterized protein n=1 Tax=Mycobacterium arosiense ATCC BAA-1401 = DSM 45069 TaxID=1265311 RepID=A0A1W9ZL48_MYCAI|nr:hypothetical protein BST14_08090 [Mycobacterium arosiense ATCC BAA-1401 = DSM 45069]